MPFANMSFCFQLFGIINLVKYIADKELLTLGVDDSTYLFNDMLSLTMQLFYERERSLFLHEPLQAASSVLDIGCGNGAYLEAVKQDYPHLKCTGLEKDERIYRYAEARNAPGLEFVQGDYREWTLRAEPFDVVIVRLVALHLPDFGHFLGWLRTVTHADSLIILIDLDDEATGPLPADCLPRFETLFRTSRKPLLDRFPKPVGDRLAELTSAHGGFRTKLQSYRIRAEDGETKRLIHRYMETVTRIMQSAHLSDERKQELDHWLNEKSLSYEAGMFALSFQRI
ncbi:class I SAM-dependent methyltransferase [Paenibacillus sp. CF384]|uniref:class I SAM-dependent methyltransferase n=1 Tax=Paenibacillus sp. CF384 TaxID=1884382 RepID=UPI00089D522F|nr:class I SAM-dependent methyltransferase [Paenibacillus sp. CF384]SDW08321.1 Methyltransferase domain-containing protein [Paenibacillus sp. CF384]